MPTIPLKVVLGIANLLIAVVVPVIVSILKPTAYTGGEQVLLAIVLFIGVTALETLFLAETAFYRARQDERIWDARDALDSRLQEVRRLFHIVQEDRRSEEDLFSSYFDQRLMHLTSALQDAANKREILIDETMLNVTTWLLKSSFRGRENDVFRAVFFADDEVFFFDLHTKRYFYQSYELLKKGKLKGVRRLIIYNNLDDLSSRRMQRLIAFHNTTDGYACRVLGQDSFSRIIKDFQLHHLMKDFGIYGDTYVYKGLTNRADEIVGLYSRDPNDIERLTLCFDSAWEAAQSWNSTETVPADNAVDWVFARDNADQRPQLPGPNIPPAVPALPSGDELLSTSETPNVVAGNGT